MRIGLVGRSRFIFSAGIFGVLCLRTLYALDVFTKVEVDGNITLSVPMSWKVTDRMAPGTVQGTEGTSATGPQASSLLLTARPSDPAQNVTLSLFRINFRTMGPPVYSGEMGSRALLEDALNVVLSQGFSATNTQVTRSTSLKETPLITAEITARNSIGDERIFTYTAIARPLAAIRLCSSRPAGSQAAAKDIESIIQTISVAGTQGQTGISSPPPPVEPAPVSGNESATFFGSPIPPGRTPASAPDAPSQLSSTGAQLVQDAHASFFIVEGQKGVGSGFFCTLGGKVFAVTNAHVMSDNSGVKLKSLNGAVFTPGSAGIAVGHDIVRIEVQSPGKPFEIMTGIDENVKIGDDVIIPGNAGGAGVVMAIEGKVVGIGPNLIEVNAPFIKGNSGSPIIHLKSGKVLGVATYLLERKVSEGGKGEVKVETRRFGYRLDSITEWQPVNWPQFYTQSAQLAKIWGVSEDFIHLFKNISQDEPLNPGNYGTAGIQRAIQEFLKTVDKGGRHNSASVADRKEAIRRLFSDLRFIARSDIGQFDTGNAYDYFRRQAADEQKLRERIQEVLSKELDSHM